MLRPEIRKTGLWMSNPNGSDPAFDIVLTDGVIGIDQISAALGRRYALAASDI